MTTEGFETQQKLSQIATMLSILIPEKFSMSYLADSTGKSRQALTKYLQRNHEPDVEWWQEGKKIFVKKEIGIAILQRHKIQKIQVD